MPKGKPWRKEQELKLKQLIGQGVTLKIIAAKLGKSEGAIRAKAGKLGLEVVKKAARKFSSTSLKIPRKLPGVEEALEILAGTLEILRVKWDLNSSWDLVPVREDSVCTLCF